MSAPELFYESHDATCNKTEIISREKQASAFVEIFTYGLGRCSKTKFCSRIVILTVFFVLFRLGKLVSKTVVSKILWVSSTFLPTCITFSSKSSRTRWEQPLTRLEKTQCICRPSKVTYTAQRGCPFLTSIFYRYINFVPTDNIFADCLICSLKLSIMTRFALISKCLRLWPTVKLDYNEQLGAGHFCSL